MRDLSGERNILLGCMAMGMTREQALARRDWIVEFADLGEFISLPMTAYSSGMAARLRFAIAASMSHEILMIDEALATGDAEFRRRSEKRIMQLRDEAGHGVPRLALPGRGPDDLQPGDLAGEGPDRHGRRGQRGRGRLRGDVRPGAGGPGAQAPAGQEAPERLAAEEAARKVAEEARAQREAAAAAAAGSTVPSGRPDIGIGRPTSRPQRHGCPSAGWDRTRGRAGRRRAARLTVLVTRIAPTPSGFLHVGNAVNMVLTHWLARAHGGRLLLRIDDFDTGRARPAYLEDVFRTLDWLGIDIDDGPSGPATSTRRGRCPRASTSSARRGTALMAGGHDTRLRVPVLAARPRRAPDGAWPAAGSRTWP